MMAFRTCCAVSAVAVERVLGLLKDRLNSTEGTKNWNADNEFDREPKETNERGSAEGELSLRHT